MTPAEREARWALLVRFAIEAADQAEARAIVDRALTSLERELPLAGEPTIAPLRIRDGIWVATLVPDLTVLASVEPDDARNRCRYVSSPDIWSRSHADDTLLHPAVQAVMIWCEARGSWSWFINIWAVPRGQAWSYPAVYELVMRLGAKTGIHFDPEQGRLAPRAVIASGQLD
jgi:hypothetical protein